MNSVTVAFLDSRPMLTKLTLQNFQRHQRLTIELDRITTIVGETDAGKSAIIRALVWVCLNDPPGDANIRHGADFAKVKLVVDGSTIVRARGKRNRYSLDGKDYAAFGNDVPPKIVDLLKVNETTFQQQHEPHFWFSATPGQVSRELNQIVNLGLIDSTLANVASEHRKARSTLEVCEARLKQAKTERKQLDWVPSIVESFNDVQAKKQRFDSKVATKLATAKLLKDVSFHSEQHLNAVRAKERAQIAVKTGAEAFKLSESVKRLKGLIRDARNARKLASISLPDIDPVETAWLEAANAKATRIIVESWIEQTQQAKDKLCAATAEIQSLEKKLRRLTKSRCPVCGAKIKS